LPIVLVRILEVNGPFVFRPYGIFYPRSRYRETTLGLNESKRPIAGVDIFSQWGSIWEKMDKPTGV